LIKNRFGCKLELEDFGEIWGRLLGQISSALVDEGANDFAKIFYYLCPLL
jgi:hypothetical protein